MQAALRARWALTVLVVIGCGGGDTPTLDVPASSASTAVRWWMTTADGRVRLAKQPDLPLADSVAVADSAVEIVLDRASTYQSMVGFGAAMTDASAWLIATQLTRPQREALLHELFGRTDDAIGLGMLRLTIGASDFSRTHYTLAELPGGSSSMVRDDSLTHFSIAPNRSDVIPVVQEVLVVNPELTVMATPWSAPAWMKSNGALAGGTLRADAYPAYAEYLRRYVVAYEAQGIPISLLSIQNEPHHEPSDYPGMRFTPAARADFIAHHLGPLFASRNVQTRLLEWDHNWDEPAAPLAVLGDSAARRFVAGVAWHCYAGEVAAQSVVHDAHPDKDAYFTECAGGAWAPDWGDNLLWNVRTLIIGTTRHWARGVMLWNLALDGAHGPHTGGCNDCRGVVTIDAGTGAVTRNEEYYALAHASRFVRRGARRVSSTSEVRDVETVAFVHDDDSVALIAVNAAMESRTLAIRDGKRSFAGTLPARSVSTYVWR